MARKTRFFLEDTALHIVVKGINQKDIFIDEEDYSFYKQLLEELSKSSLASIHAYSLLSSQVNMLCTFHDKESLSRFMQSLGVKYVSYFNKKYARSGTLWEGRYKSSIVEDKYVIQVMYYIESFKNDKYNSFLCNAYNKNDNIVQEHEMYVLLGKDDKDRASLYQSRLLKEPLNQELISFIELHLSKQTITGSLEYYKILEEQIGESLVAKQRGRPKKKLNKRKNMFTKLVALDKKEHKSLKVSPLEDLKFAQNLSFVPVLINETSVVAEMFPVVFSANEKASLIALTSLGGTNLAINSDGKYITKHVPAYLRRYPFSFAPSKDNNEQKIVLIDEQASCVSKSKGKQLFTKNGSQSELLDNAIKFLTEYEKQEQVTKAMIKAIRDQGILEDREISVGEAKDKKVLVKGFQVVSKEKLNQLDDKTLASWVRNGIINFIDIHLKSLTKIDVLFKLANQTQQS